LSRSAASVVAADINEEVLAIARSKPVDHRKTTFRKEDAYDLPTFPRKFTSGLAAFWWSHVPKARLRDFLRGFFDRRFADGFFCGLSGSRHDRGFTLWG